MWQVVARRVATSDEGTDDEEFSVMATMVPDLPPALNPQSSILS